MFFKKTQYESDKVFFIAHLCLIGVLCLLAFVYWEYRSAQEQSQQLLAVRSEYQTWVVALQQSYETRDNALASVEPSLENNHAEQSLHLVNRDTTYLKNSALSYLKEQRLQEEISRLDEETWCNYTDQVLIDNQKKVTRKKHVKRAAPIPKKRSNRRQLKTPGIKVPGFFSLPLERSKFWISSFFGPRRKPSGRKGFHYGIDMAALKGTPVYATADGVVRRARYETGYGNAILIQHDNRYRTRYAHLHKVYVQAGQRIKKGDLIGAVGDTGHTITRGKDASHLHFEVHEYGKPVNPLHFLAL